MKHRALIVAAAIVGLLVGIGVAPHTDAFAQSKASASKRTATPIPQIRTNQVRSRHILDGGIGDNDLSLSITAVSIGAAATTVTTAANPSAAGGAILGYYPTGNQDQLVDNIVLNANGSVTVTLAAAATATNTFNVVVSNGVPSQ